MSFINFMMQADHMHHRRVRQVRSRLAYKKLKAFDPVKKLSENKFKKRYRMSKYGFARLCAELRQLTSLRGSQRMTLEHKVLTALRFFACGSYQENIGESTAVCQRSVSSCITEVANALYQPAVSEKWIKFPTTRSERDEVKRGFYEAFNFPGVVGAIDCSHITIVKPMMEDEHCYYNRKGNHSINAQMICDSNLKILHVNAKFGGNSHDSHIWATSAANTYMQQLWTSGECVWLLGDSGYPLRQWLMTPIGDAEPNSTESRYNDAHSAARSCIERTFGVLKNRFRCVLKHRVLHYHPDKASKIIVACCVLHNMLLNPEFHDFNSDDDDTDNSDDDSNDDRDYDSDDDSDTETRDDDVDEDSYDVVTAENELGLGRRTRNFLLARF